MYCTTPIPADVMSGRGRSPSYEEKWRINQEKLRQEEEHRKYKEYRIRLFEEQKRRRGREKMKRHHSKKSREGSSSSSRSNSPEPARPRSPVEDKKVRDTSLERRTRAFIKEIMDEHNLRPEEKPSLQLQIVKFMSDMAGSPDQSREPEQRQGHHETRRPKQKSSTKTGSSKTPPKGVVKSESRSTGQRDYSQPSTSRQQDVVVPPRSQGDRERNRDRIDIRVRGSSRDSHHSHGSRRHSSHEHSRPDRIRSRSPTRSSHLGSGRAHEQPDSTYSRREHERRTSVSRPEHERRTSVSRPEYERRTSVSRPEYERRISVPRPEHERRDSVSRQERPEAAPRPQSASGTEQRRQIRWVEPPASRSPRTTHPPRDSRSNIDPSFRQVVEEVVGTLAARVRENPWNALFRPPYMPRPPGPPPGTFPMPRPEEYGPYYPQHAPFQPPTQARPPYPGFNPPRGRGGRGRGRGRGNYPNHYHYPPNQ